MVDQACFPGIKKFLKTGRPSLIGVLESGRLDGRELLWLHKLMSNFVEKIGQNLDARILRNFGNDSYIGVQVL